MTDEEATDLFITARYIAKKLEKHYEATSLNFGIQDGLVFLLITILISF